MSLAKATVTGTVYRAPEKRFTQNDVAVYGLTLNIDDKEETLVRVIAKRRALSEVLDTIQKGDKILVDGRLQVASTKAADGTERRFYEIDANDIELMNKSSSGNTSSTIPAVQSQPQEEIVTFAETDYSENNLIDEEEIPF